MVDLHEQAVSSVRTVFHQEDCADQISLHPRWLWRGALVATSCAPRHTSDMAKARYRVRELSLAQQNANLLAFIVARCIMRASWVVKLRRLQCPRGTGVAKWLRVQVLIAATQLHARHPGSPTRHGSACLMLPLCCRGWKGEPRPNPSGAGLAARQPAAGLYRIRETAAASGRGALPAGPVVLTVSRLPRSCVSVAWFWREASRFPFYKRLV
jgi:hypothetical protein